jgi:diguanylate cyclase (GGDEF)-like protein
MQRGPGDRRSKRAGEKRSVHTPLVERPTSKGRPGIPILRVVAGRDVLRFLVLPTGGALELGRDLECGLTLNDASVSRRHARVEGGDAGFAVLDLGSRNGMFVNGTRVERASLQTGDLLELGSVPLRVEVVSLEELAHLRGVVERLESGDRDPLTGLLTRRFLDEHLASVLERSARSGSPTTAVFVDLDRFKSINDGFGHAVGDDVLRQVARLLAFSVREGEACVRYGGEELLVIAEGASEEQAAALGERLREAVVAHDWSRIAKGLAVTVSCGIAERGPDEASRDWLERADRALYRAKHDGRNRVVRASMLE